MARCLIGCGSNVGRRRDFLDRAIELIRFMPGVSLLAVSRFRQTRPIGGPAGQEPFLNGACLIETDLSPHDVLAMLSAVENTLHRERVERWGPRTIDLDLLLYDDLILDTETLTLPHPRMPTRRFVLEPCVEIAPDLRHPLAGCTLAEMLESISAPQPRVAVVGLPGTGAQEVAAAIAETMLDCHVTAVDAVGVPHGDDMDRELDDDLARLACDGSVLHAVLLLTSKASSSTGRRGQPDLQRRLIAALCGPGRRSPLVPKAVVAIDSTDRARATAEAIAAVEAMV